MSVSSTSVSFTLLLMDMMYPKVVSISIVFSKVHILLFKCVPLNFHIKYFTIVFWVFVKIFSGLILRYILLYAPIKGIFCFVGGFEGVEIIKIELIERVVPHLIILFENYHLS